MTDTKQDICRADMIGVILMNNLIYRQAAIDILDAYQVMVENGEENPYAWARLRMSELPPVQPEPTLEQIEEYCHKRCLSIVDNALLHKYAQAEIIRCKDCKHLQKWRSEESAKKFGQIYECGIGVLRDPLPDGSCSKAERRTDE